MSIRKGSKTIAGAPLESVWGTISGNIADQADLKNALDGKADISSAELVGTPTAPTPPIGSYNDRIATTKFVSDSIGSAGIIPPQQGHGGEFLSTDGESAFWSAVDTFPEQEGQSGKFLTTNGTSVSWGSVDLSGKVDKVTSTSSKNRFYIITPAGVQSTLEGEQTGQTAATVAIRTSSGTVRTAAPTDNNDAATKKYVDDGLKEKLDGYNIYVAGSWTGGAHAVKFVTVDYSGADSENGVFIKISMVNSHGNGITGRFYQDVVLNVNYTGTVAGTIYRYFAESVESSMSYSDHKWGDIFWTIDTTNKIVKFFVIMRQFSYTYETPYFRLNASTKGEITQHSGVNSEEYSSGTQYWATIYDYNEIPTQTGQSGKFLTTNGTSVSWTGISQVPSQSGQSGKFLTTNGTTASWANVDAFPTQSGNNGKFLTTDGSSVSWATVDALPTQTGQSGKFLTTDGTYASWETIDAFPTQTGQSGKFLTTDGSTVSWANAPTEIPSQSGNSGKFLTTNGSAVSWANINALKNNSTGNYSLSILGTSSHAYETIIGSGTSSSNAGTVVVGANASAVGADSTAIGYNAHTNAASAIQIGEGTNSSAATLSIGFGESAGTVRNYTLLNGSTGKIPDERLNNPIPSQSGQSGKYLTTDGSSISWASVPSNLPSQSGQSGKYLTTDGSSASWASISIPSVDQTYDGTSTNAQSGVAVKSAIDSAISSVYKPAGSVAFANLPTLGSTYEGYVYNVSDDFTTTADFVEGAGHNYPAGTNVVCVNTATSGTAVYKWDVLAGFIDLSGYVKKDGTGSQQTIQLTSGTGTTALGVKSRSTSSYISFNNSSGWIGSYGVTSEKKPTFYNGTSYTLAYVENTVAANTAITGATKCKITYDSKGLVTAGADLSASDIPDISGTYQTVISDLETIRSGASAGATALQPNTAITGATKCKITYDAHGLVTAGADLSASDIPSITLSKISDVTATATELNYVDGVTSAIQTQLDNKVDISGDTMTGNLQMGTNAGIYLTGIASTVANSTSRLNLGTPNNVYAYLTGNSSGAFGIYSETSGTRKGIACYPDTNFFADATTKTIDLGRSNNVWKTGYIDTLSNGTSSVALSTLIAKQDAITGAASTITSDNLTANRAVISNSSGKIAVSSVTSTELGYLSGVTSAIQTQLGNKQATLVSGTNIKTINNQSILGSGNIDIQGGGTTVEAYTASEVQTIWDSVTPT